MLGCGSSIGCDRVFPKKYILDNLTISIHTIAVHFEMTSFYFEYCYTVIYLLCLIWGHQIKIQYWTNLWKKNFFYFLFIWNANMTECSVFLFVNLAFLSMLSHVLLILTLWTGAWQSLPRQEYWSRLPFPPSVDLPDPGIKPTSLGSCIGRWILNLATPT